MARAKKNRSPSPATSFAGERANRQGTAVERTVSRRQGRPPAWVRESYRMELSESLEFLKKVRDCDPTIKRDVQVATLRGDVVTLQVEPTINERIRAVEVIGKFSGVASTRADDEPPPLPPSGFDLTRLGVKELEHLETLLKAAEVKKPLTLASGVEVHTR